MGALCRLGCSLAGLTNPNVLRSSNFSFACFEFYLHKFCDNTKKGGEIVYFCDFYAVEFSFAELFLTEPPFFYFCMFFFFCVWVSFSWGVMVDSFWYH